MLKLIGIVIVLLILVVLYATTRPDKFRVQRTASIMAPPDKVFAHINDLHAWESWSPYLKLDPAMQSRYSGADKGLGAGYEWQGNSKIGAGRMTIIDVAEPDRVGIKLEMLKPFVATNNVTFTLQPTAGGTDVTWAMDGCSNLISKVMSLFMDMDKMVGSQFEEGLANLKAVVER